MKRRFISTRQHGVISQKTLTFTVTAVELESISDSLFPFSSLLFLFSPTFSCFFFYFSCFLSTHTSPSLFLLLSVYFLLPLYSCFVIPFPLFPPSPSVYLLVTSVIYLHVLLCLLISCKQLPANDRCCLCVCPVSSHYEALVSLLL